MSEYTLYMATILLVMVFAFTSKLVFSLPGSDDVAEYEAAQLSSVNFVSGDSRAVRLDK